MTMSFEEACEALGYICTKWQADIGNRILRGENVSILWPRESGKAVTKEIIDYAKEHSNDSIYDERDPHARQPRRDR